jgi:predicted DNA-binding transcriptional regulator YafY
MKEIVDNPGCSTKDIARNVAISERSVKRYIDTLNVAGAIIEFRSKGWYCEVPIWDLL